MEPLCVGFEKQTDTKLSWVKDVFYVTIASRMTGEGEGGGVIGAEPSIVAASPPHIGDVLSMRGTQGAGPVALSIPWGPPIFSHDNCLLSSSVGSIRQRPANFKCWISAGRRFPTYV